MNFSWKKDAIEHAKQCEPQESCGILAIQNNQLKYFSCKNYTFNTLKIP